MSAEQTDLTVAVTGPTGTFGYGLLPLLQADERVSRIIGIARRPFDPAEHGWTKMIYRRGDVREVDALRQAFEGADVVVHLAFLILGGRKDSTRAINIEGTLNAFRAAAASGARRFVYASSVAAYGFHRDNPDVITEDWPTRPADRLFYAQEKAELEELLRAEAAEHPQLELYLLRPPGVLGPHAVGGKEVVPGWLLPLAQRLKGPATRLAERWGGRLPVRLPMLAPDLLLQFVHEDDVGSALLQCVVAAGPPGAYNIAGDGPVSMIDIVRDLGFLAVPLPARQMREAARWVAGLRFLPSGAAWAEALSQPPVMDTAKARTQLGWTPRFTGREALQATLPGR